MMRIDQRIRMRVNRHWIRKGHERAGIPLGEQDEEPLDVFDQIAREPDLSVRFDLGAGDVFFADNHSMLHNRTAFTDDAEQPRCLVRLWIRRPC